MLSEKFLKLRSRAYAKKNKNQHPVSYTEAKSFGILYTTEDEPKHQSVKTLIKNLESDGKKVHTITYLPKDKENYEFKFDFFTKKDITFAGKIKSESVLNFLNSPFDFLILLDFEYSEIAGAVLSQSKAKCRIGSLNSNGSQYFEFMMDSGGGNYNKLIEDIFKYIKLL